MNQTSDERTFLQRLSERLNQSRYFTISLLLHTILLIVAGTLVVTQQDEPPAYIPEGGVVPPFDTPPPPPENDRPKIVEFKTPDPSPKEPPAPRDTRPLPPVVVNQDPGSLFKTFSDPALKEVPITLTPPPTAISHAPSWIPADMIGRFEKDGSGHIVGMRGGTGAGIPKPPRISEEAVMRALYWLRDNQNKDGSWGDKNKGAMTGLALLCFLGHGEIGESNEFGYTVRNAVQWFLNEGTKHEGRLSMTAGGWGPGNAGVYEHAIATYALGEYRTMSKDDRVIELLKQAVGYIVTGQGPDGGWMYSYDKSQSDTSVSGWQVQALKAAHLTELPIPGVGATLDNAMKNFDRVQGPNGGYGYRTPEDRYSLTGVGILCELFWKGTRNKDLHQSVDFIRDKTDKDFPVQYQGEKGDLYAWYYHTQAMFMYGGAVWSYWERKFSNEIIKAQSRDGSWPEMRVPGHGNLQTATDKTGQVYRTTLCTLMLEVYYRYMPVHRSEAGPRPEKLATR
jgi:hypothetical protein